MAALEQEQIHVDTARSAMETELSRLRAQISEGRIAAATQHTEAMIREQISTSASRINNALHGRDTPIIGRLVLNDGRSFLVGQRYEFSTYEDVFVVHSSSEVGAKFFRASPSDPMGIRETVRYSFGEPWNLTRVQSHILIGTPKPDDEADTPAVEELEEQFERDEREWIQAALRDVKRTPEFRDSLATLAKNQHRITQLPLSGVLIVQGGPGTGKTMVGLERAAYANYTLPKTANDVLFVVPSQRFLDYVKPTVQSHGIDDVSLKLIQEISSVSVIPTTHDDEAVARFKGDAAMVAILELAVWSLMRTGGFAARFEGVDTPRVLEFNIPSDRVATMIDTTRADTASYTGGRARFREIVGQEVNEAIEEFNRGMRGWIPKSLDASINALVNKIWPEIEPQRYLRSLYKDGSALRVAATSLNCNTHLEAFLHAAARTAASDAWTPHDVPLLDELHRMAEKRVGHRYAHIVVDEAQNLTPMQTRMIMRSAAYQTEAVTFLGDLAQMTGPVPYRSWEEFISTMPDHVRETVHQESLVVGYRVPAPIMNLANKVLNQLYPQHVLPRVEPILDEGPEPTTLLVDEDQVIPTMLEQVEEILEDPTIDQLVIIAPPLLVEAARAALGPVMAGLNESNPEKSLEVVDVGDASGLEVDATIVIEPRTIMALSPTKPGPLYVALTRAARRLVIISSAPVRAK